jgi:MurNAc alpha-1-phosphate uridylyltransferase
VVKAFILAAGYGKRMHPLTLSTPKPLLMVGGKPLIARHVKRLVNAGVTELVINLHHLGEQIEQYLGSGERFGASIYYSREAALMETGGGILNAMPLLGPAPFIVVNGDIYTDYDFGCLHNRLPLKMDADDTLGHLVMVNNPPEHPGGDFSLSESERHGRSRLIERHGKTLTFSGISVLRPELFSSLAPGPSALINVLMPAIREGRMTGEHFHGHWSDVGTIEKLNRLNRESKDDQ